jgi:GT2 family glycosyltransferase
MEETPKVSVIIPHWNGKEILRRCLVSVEKTRFGRFTVLIVDNGSTDDSVDMVRSEFPGVQITHSSDNLGFAGGCNLGIQSSSSPYIALLNNDAEVSPGWLEPLVEIMEENPSVASVQPKILSMEDPHRFDYSGGGGGEIDLFGYPYAWGRLFNTTEQDTGQYNSKRAVFWASGAATLLRRSSLEHVGLLDDIFFAHMEEIDLNWRLQIAGYSVIAEPRSIVYHQTGATLNSGSFLKMVLNHRNNLMMLLKNHSAVTLCWLFPLRLFLEGLTLVISLLTGKFKRAIAVIVAFFGVVALSPKILQNRKKVQGLWRISEISLLHRMYRGSVVFSYFIKGIHKVSNLSKQRMQVYTPESRMLNKFNEPG